MRSSHPLAAEKAKVKSTKQKSGPARAGAFLSLFPFAFVLFPFFPSRRIIGKRFAVQKRQATFSQVDVDGVGRNQFAMGRRLRLGCATKQRRNEP
jgi:hypothetical protein